MAKVEILGPDGTPLRGAERQASLGRPLAVQTMTGVRRAWDAESIASGLTPEALASLLRQADEGEGRAYLRLAHEMEQRDAHYRSVLSTRKRAVTRLPITVEAVSDAAADVALADEVRAVTRAPGFRQMIGHALDAIGKGYAVIEMRWDTSRAPWMPRDRRDKESGEMITGYSWIDPRWFRYDRIDARTLRLLDDSSPVDGLPLAPYRFILHAPALISGQPLGGGLARVACVAYMAKSYALKDWLSFAEVYGMPLRVGKYGAGATEEDIATLVSALANLGTDAAAAIPESMLIEFVSAQSGTGGDVFAGLADWADKQVSKAVLGQTASADGTPGALGNQQAQDTVRDDLRDSDAEELSDTLNRDLVAAYLALNHGEMDPSEAPCIVLRAPEQEDIKQLTDSLAALVPLGLRVEASVVRDKLGLPDPPDGEAVELLGAPAPAVNDLASPLATPLASSTNRLDLNRKMDGEPDTPAQQGDRLGREAGPLVDAMLATVRRELDAAPSLEVFRDRLLTLYPELGSTDLMDLLGMAFAAADLAGRLEAQP